LTDVCPNLSLVIRIEVLNRSTIQLVNSSAMAKLTFVQTLHKQSISSFLHYLHLISSLNPVVGEATTCKAEGNSGMLAKAMKVINICCVWTVAAFETKTTATELLEIVMPLRRLDFHLLRSPGNGQSWERPYRRFPQRWLISLNWITSWVKSKPSPWKNSVKKSSDHQVFKIIAKLDATIKVGSLMELIKSISRLQLFTSQFDWVA